jgi:hypothetical protein
MAVSFPGVSSGADLGHEENDHGDVNPLRALRVMSLTIVTQKLIQLDRDLT